MAVEARCDQLVRQRQFIQDCGVQELPSGETVTRYRFIHTLYQNVLYERVSAARRVQLHRRIGEQGEKVYGEQVRWHKVQVRQCALDDIVDDLKGIRFFKCDVEGYELDVFKGATVFFALQRPTFVVEISLNAESIAFFNRFASEHSYTIYYMARDGLVKLNELYAVDWRGNFLFSQYSHIRTFVPTSQFEEFVDAAWETART